MRTKFMVRVMPFLRSLDLSFFARLTAFVGVLYYALYMIAETNKQSFAINEPPRNSANRYSKTFGHEKQLNEIME